jgi:hypothetical protein
MKKLLLSVTVLALAYCSLLAQTAHKVVRVEDVKWVDHPIFHAHYTWTRDEETILQVQFMGPGGIEFIDAADDPRKK